MLLACSDDADSAPTPGEDFSCAIGSLTGTWRVTYTEVDGTCGAIAAETVNFSATGSNGSDPCTYHAQKVSGDKCRLDFDYTCPTTDGKGSTRWTGVTKQTGTEKLESDATVQGTHPSAGTCRSTYTMVWAKL